MTEIDWTTVISNLGSTTGLAGVIASVIVAVLYTRKQKHAKDEETQAVNEVSTPAFPGGGSDDAQAWRMARQAMDLTTELSERLGRVEKELGLLSVAYKSLYGWARTLRRDWPTLRELADPPPFPDDVHHPR